MKATIFNGQQTSLFNGTQHPFVVGIQDVSAGVQQPKIAMIDEGIKLTWRATQSSEAKKVQIEGRVELSKIAEAHTASTLPYGAPTTIQIPSVKRCRIEVSSEVQEGQSLLISCIPTSEQERYLYVLLKVPKVWTSKETN